MSINLHTPYNTNSEYTPESMNQPLGDLDRNVGFLKNVIISCDGDISANKTTGVVTWVGNIHILFAKSTDGKIIENTVAAGTITLAAGEYMYVDLVEANGTIIGMNKALPTLDSSAAPLTATKIVIAFRNAASGEFYLANVLSKLSTGNTTPGVNIVSLKADVTALPGNLLYLTPTGYDLADNTDLTKLRDILICKVGGTGSCTVVEYGYYIHNAGGLTAGEPVYVDTAGALTQIKPTAAGSFIKCVGYAIDSFTIHFAPDTYEISTTATGGGVVTLDGLNDVVITTPADTEILTFEAATSLWKNKPAPSGGSGGGVPAGGTTGQALVKNSAADYDTHWADLTGGGSLTNLPNAVIDILSPSKKGGKTYSTKTEYATLAANGSVTILDYTGGQPGYADSLLIAISSTTSLNPYVDIYVDGEVNPSISVPCSQLAGAHYIGSSLGNKYFTSKYIGANSATNALSYYFTLPIPFSTALRIVIRNTSSGSGTLWSTVSYKTGIPNIWSRTQKLKVAYGTGDAAPNSIVTFIDTVGKGRIAGLWLLVDGYPGGNTPRLASLEGNIKFYIDGDISPTYESGGTEDYFLQGFYYGNSVAPTNSHEVGITYRDTNSVGGYRFHIDSPWYFDTGLKITWNAGDTSQVSFTGDVRYFYTVWYYEGTEALVLTEPYIVSMWGGDVKPSASQVMLVHKAPITFTLPTGLSGSYATLETAATTQTDFDVQKNGVSIGTIRFAAGGTTATFIFASQISFAAGDVLKIIAPSSQDNTALGFACSLNGTRG